MLGLIRENPHRFNAVRRDIEGLTPLGGTLVETFESLQRRARDDIGEVPSAKDHALAPSTPFRRRLSD